MGMIKNWHYDPGETYYMSAIDRWSDPRPPAWRGRVDYRSAEDIIKWLESNIKTFDITLRFNSGDPYYEITIEDRAEAVAFYIAWG